MSARTITIAMLATGLCALSAQPAQAQANPRLGVTYTSTEVGNLGKFTPNFNIQSKVLIDNTDVNEEASGDYLYEYFVPANPASYGKGTGIGEFTVQPTFDVYSFFLAEGWTHAPLNDVDGPQPITWTANNGDTTVGVVFSFLSFNGPTWGYAQAEGEDGSEWTDFAAYSAGNSPDLGVVVPGVVDHSWTAALLGGAMTIMGLIPSMNRKLE